MAGDEQNQTNGKRSRISQAELPNMTLEQALRIPEAIWENFAGKDAPPHSVAMAIDMSPTSGTWRNLCGAAVAYGLTEGGYNASSINLSELGRRIVAPTEEDESMRAMQEASLLPRVPKEFFRKYNNAKFPRDDIAQNVLVSLGIPKERAKQAVEIIKTNGEFVGFIQGTKTGLFVATDLRNVEYAPQPAFEVPADQGLASGRELDSVPRVAERSNVPPFNSQEGSGSANSRVFITHGKNTAILEQIKKLVSLGGFDPIISMQRETAAKPVPEKVMDDMRSCGAAIIHAGSESVLYDSDGKEYPQINPNVLIEIGAAMALYKGRFIFVVEEGVKLPSNLQGMYESR